MTDALQKGKKRKLKEVDNFIAENYIVLDILREKKVMEKIQASNEGYLPRSQRSLTMGMYWIGPG